MARTFHVLIERDEDGYLISDVVELSGCRTQAKSYDALMIRTKEAIELCLEVEAESGQAEEDQLKFVGVQEIEV